MLEYTNDPWILGKETIDGLIEKEEVIFLDKQTKILNLFSAFVKREDFENKEKIVQPLQKAIYGKLSDGLLAQIKIKCSSEDTLVKKLEKYTGKRSNIHKTMARWFKTGIFPLVVLRILSEDMTSFAGWLCEIEYFTDFLNKSKFYSPRTLEEALNPSLIYLVGCSIGDGHIDKAGKRWVLVDGSSNKDRLKLSQEFLERLSNLLKKYITHTRIKRYSNKYVLTIDNKPFCRFVNFFFGLPRGKKKGVISKKPQILNLSPVPLEQYLWRGCFDTDGSVNKDGAVDFCSSDRNLLTECKNFLWNKEVESNIGKRSLVVRSTYLKKFCVIGFAHPRKQQEFIEVLRRGVKFNSVFLKDNERENIPQELLKIYSLIRVDDNYRIRINRTNLKWIHKNIDDVELAIRKIFGYELKTSVSGLYYFKSKKVYEYLRRFFIYQPAWQSITEEESIQLLNGWNDVWTK